MINRIQHEPMPKIQKMICDYIFADRHSRLSFSLSHTHTFSLSLSHTHNKSSLTRLTLDFFLRWKAFGDASDHFADFWCAF